MVNWNLLPTGAAGAYILAGVAGLGLAVSPYIRVGSRRVRRRGIYRYIQLMGNSDIAKRVFFSKQSDERAEMQRKISEAGLVNVTPEEYQVMQFITPLIIFIVVTAIAYTNVLNRAANMDKLIEIMGSTSNLGEGKLDLKVILGLSMVGYFVPGWILLVMARYRKARGSKEVIMLLTYTIMMLKTRRSVKYILSSLKSRSKLYRNSLERAVNSYSRSPEKALERLGKEVSHPLFDKICVALQRALCRDPQTSIVYLENHRVLSRELRRIHMKEKNTKKSMFGLVLLIAPLTVFIMVAGYPWLMYALRQLEATNF